MTKYINYSP